jgi:hypothetical protein
MKLHKLLTVLAIVILAGSCKKDNTPNPNVHAPARVVRYELYTDQDFSNNQSNIDFTLHMHSNRLNFDSALATMKVKDIPDFEHRIIVEKSVPGNDTSTLVVGFVYQIENVGTSWYLEQFPGQDTLRVVRYSFR